MNPKHLYTYLPKDNTAEKDGLLSTALAPHGWEKYRGRADIPTDADKEAVLAGLERMDTGRSRAISVFTEPIGTDAPEGVRRFADSHQLYAMPSYKELKAMGLVSDLIRCVRHRKQTIRVNDANYGKIDWSQTAPHENGFGLSGTPHYLLVTTKGKIPAELVKKAGYGFRHNPEDGFKGNGWLGPHSLPDGSIMTELSVTDNGQRADGRIHWSMRGKDTPALNPLLTKAELEQLKKNPKVMPDSIYNKAVLWGRYRRATGSSPFLD